jgi:acyl-CoA thioester hydrolase
MNWVGYFVSRRKNTMAKNILTYRGIVYPWHCDHMGHMNVMWYTSKFDEASWQLLSALGLSQSRFVQDGSGMVAVEQHTKYKRESHSGDAITIHSSLLEVREKSLRLVHEMQSDTGGESVATTEIVAVHIDATLRKAARIPLDVRVRAQELLPHAAPAAAFSAIAGISDQA